MMKVNAKESFVIMPSIKEHLYNKFENSYFGFLISPVSEKYDHGGLTVENIDLYYQPTQDPMIGVIFFALRLPLVISGLIINMKVLRLMKQEKGLVMDVTSFFAIVQMMFWPSWWLFTTSTDFIHPLNIVLGEWFCHLGSFFIHLGMYIISFHSLVVAMMRYFFIIHQDKVDKHGREKVKRIFFWLSFIIPLVIVTIQEIEKNELDMFSFINKCYGKHHEVFLIETSTRDVFKRNFCEFESYELGNSMSYVLNGFRRASCIIRTTTLLLTSFNISEAIIYFVLFAHMIRYAYILE